MAGGPAETSRAAREPSTTNQVRRSSRLASAYDTTNRLFNALLPYFGQQALMPMVYFTPTLGPGGHDIRTDPVAADAQAWPRGYQPSGYGDTGVIAYPAGAQTLSNDVQNVFGRMPGVDTLTHELAHVFQNPALLNAPWQQRQTQMEGGAEGFTELVRNQLARVLGLRPPAPYAKPYGPMGEDFINQYGQDYTLHGQFQF